MKNILIFGDSNTWGFDAATYDPQLGTVKRMGWEERWPGRVQMLLGDGYHIIENALNARTCMAEDPYFPRRQGLESLQVALDANAPLDLVVLKLGCNELKHMFNLTAGMIAYGLEKLVGECKTSYYGYPPPQVLVIAPAPTHPAIGEMMFGFSFGPDAHAKSCELGKHYKELAKRNGCGFLDCAPLCFELNTVDGLHYSKADHAKLAPLVAEKIREMLG
ncbi:MAG: hypothetical protein GXY67_08730 [Clostridiales bacterium]|nr:hypothetical protein [Clostridiales bacterium]